MPYFFWYDGTYILVIIGAVICMLASAKVNTTFNKYAAYRSMSGMTGAQAAEKILHSAGIYDVEIRHISGKLTDNYNPANKTLNLSDSTYHSASVAAVGVAAHECGHAIQHQKSYFPLTLRSAIVPIANFGSTLAWPIIIIGLFFNGSMSAMLINIGILMFSFAWLVFFITLQRPIEQLFIRSGTQACACTCFFIKHFLTLKQQEYEENFTFHHGADSFPCVWGG